MKSASSVPVRDAVVLAAGNGDRFKNGTRHSKLLAPVFGQPLILRTLSTAADAGITHVHVVLGYEAERLRPVIEQGRPPNLSLTFTHNPDWHLENGVSVLCARPGVADRRFALLMGDHLFEASSLAMLLRAAVRPEDSVLAVDSSPASPDVVAEATKVQLRGNRIVAIGKDLPTHDALDTGLFVCAPSLFDALEDARPSGDTTLSAGIRRLAARGLMRAVDIGRAAWFDIDTVADLRAAEQSLSTSAA